MKSTKLYIGILTLLVLNSCGYEWEQQGPKRKTQEAIVVESTVLAPTTIKEEKTFFGRLKFSKGANFIAQQPGVVTQLNAVAGQRVNKGAILAVYPPMNHQLQVDQAIIQRDKFKRDYLLQKELYETGAVPKMTVNELETQLKVQEKYIQQLQGVNIIRAPFSGVITQVHTSVGQEVEMSAPMISMAQTDDIEVEFYVIPKHIQHIQLGLPVHFEFDGTKQTGKITKKAIQADPQRRAFLVSASIENTGFVPVGSSVSVTVQTGESSEGIWIPSDAFRLQGKTNSVFIEKNGRAIQRTIELGKRREDFVQVLGGLKEGETLITSGIDKLSDQSPVTVKNSK